MILSSELQRAGYTVVMAADGEEAIRALGRGMIDLALLDVKMPKVDGLAVLRFIKEKSPATKVIILTSFADLSMAMEAKENGAIDLVSKPFSLDDVLALVSQSLTGP